MRCWKGVLGISVLTSLIWEHTHPVLIRQDVLGTVVRHAGRRRHVNRCNLNKTTIFFPPILSKWVFVLLLVLQPNMFQHENIIEYFKCRKLTRKEKASRLADKCDSRSCSACCGLCMKTWSWFKALTHTHTQHTLPYQTASDKKGPLPEQISSPLYVFVLAMWESKAELLIINKATMPELKNVSETFPALCSGHVFTDFTWIYRMQKAKCEL